MKNKDWVIAKIAQDKKQELMQEYNVTGLLAQVMVNRQIDTEEKINAFFKPSIENLYSPFLMKGMEKAIERILKAVKSRERILVFGDYDVDGITSTAVLYRFLLSQGARISHYIPNRLSEGYGLNIEAINKIKHDTDLIITVDCGISAIDEARYIKASNIDLIITDHHECPEELPNAYCIINPKQRECQYPFKGLAGVGVTFKLITALANRLGLEDKEYLKYLDIVCLGTIADVVPLLDENRIITKFGINIINSCPNPGIRALLNVSNVAKATSWGIAFGLCPRINASGRLGDSNKAVELLVEDDYERAQNIAKELDQYNKKRQETEINIYREALNLIDKDRLFEDDIIVVGAQNWHHGVIGIVASKICELYYKPCILLCYEDGIARGSARSVEGFDLYKALTNSKNLLEKYGGHELAAGLTLKIENVDNLRQQINKYAKQIMLKPLQPSLTIDGCIDDEDITLDSVAQLQYLEPFGAHNPQPIFTLNEVIIKNIQAVGTDNKHIRLKISKKNNDYDGIGFNMIHFREKLSNGDIIKLAHTLEINEFRGNKNIQFNIKDIKIG